MTTGYETPPNGDFARYVDELTRESASRLALEVAVGPTLTSSALLSPGQVVAQGRAAALKATARTVTSQAGRQGAHTARRSTAAKPSAAKPSTSKPFVAPPFVQHVQWVVGLWIATQALGHFVPGAGFLFIPALGAYAVWTLSRMRREGGGTALDAVVRHLKRMAEDAKNAQGPKPPGR